MQVEIRSGALAGQQVDAIVLGVAPGRTLENEAAAIDAQLRGGLKQALDDNDFSGKVGTTLVIPTLGQIPARRLVVTGVGDAGRRTAFDLTRAWGAAARAARAAGARTVASASPPAVGEGTAEAFRAATEGVTLALYRFLAYRTVDLPTKVIDAFAFYDDRSEAHKGVELGNAIAQGVCLARDLANQPADVLYPDEFALRAQEVALQNDMACIVYDRPALENMGAGAIVAVGKGSERDPRLIHLTYRPSGESRGTIAFIGKGITFDTGGMNLKPTGGIEAMKFDMCGGAAVLGAMSAIPALNLPYTVHGIITAAENMPSGTAFRPGDILHTMNGKTIEIISTDAEGRLVLADALTYTSRLGVDAMIDLATLTGSSVVALGKQGTSVFSTDDSLAGEILDAADWNGEKMWHMPLWEEYHSELKGDYADLRNSGGRQGGAIFAALFLREFIEGTPWAHLDIAGPAWNNNETELAPAGASGHGVRTLLTLLLNRAAG
ncbi:MAG TPA: leucyl aminopeptidase [Nitrolancea sp.]|nr:leucyl aminopeptidase [Nitrolancea sp.]